MKIPEKKLCKMPIVETDVRLYEQTPRYVWRKMVSVTRWGNILHR